MLAVLGRVRRSTHLREGKGTKNMDRVTRPTPTADTLFSSCENETNVKMRKIGSLGQ